MIFLIPVKKMLWVQSLTSRIFCTQNIQSINLQCLKTIMSKGKLLISQFQISRIVYTELLL